MNDAAVKFLPLLFLLVWSIPPLPHHGQFPSSFTTALFPVQFLYLSQSTHSLGILLENLKCNTRQSLWNANENRNQIYLECQGGRIISVGCHFCRESLCRGCIKSHRIKGRAGDGLSGISDSAWGGGWGCGCELE